jgi:hypothetical protein
MHLVPVSPTLRDSWISSSAVCDIPTFINASSVQFNGELTAVAPVASSYALRVSATLRALPVKLTGTDYAQTRSPRRALG